MPELPEVQTTVYGLQSLVNHQITNIFIYSTKLRYKVPLNIKNLLINNKIINIYRVGKYIIFNLRNRYSLIIHLGMSGRLRILKNNKLKRKKHDHFIMIIKELLLIYNDPRKFGFIDLVKTEKIFKKKYIQNLGFDALDIRLSTDYLYNKINKSTVPIKQILLNQSIISGIGNIYACEILFNAKISPFKRGCNISFVELKKLILSIRKILNKAIESGGSTLRDYKNTDGTIGNFQKNFKVYDREGKKINGEKILRKIQYGRSTFYCPKIQI